MRVLIFLLALLFFTPANATITISSFDQGGNVETYMRFWDNVAKSGEDVVIDAPCMSACTFFLGYISPEKVCITARASLGLHQLSSDDNPDPVISASFYRWLYPEWVQQWIKDHGGLKPEVMIMYPEDMKGHIKLCSGDYDTVSPEQLIHQNSREE